MTLLSLPVADCPALQVAHSPTELSRLGLVPLATDPRPLVIAHRGGASLYGVSLSAFLTIASIGADMVEFDVRRTCDGVLVVYHDEAIDGVPIATLTYHALLSSLQGQASPPTLEDIVIALRGKIHLDVELKESGYERDVLDLLRRHLDVPDFVVTSFKDQVVTTVKALWPEVQVGLLLGVVQPRRPIATRLREIFPFGRVSHCQADFIAIHYRLVALHVLEAASMRHIPVLIWTVNDPHRLRRLLGDPRVMGVVTDVPDTARFLLGDGSPTPVQPA